MRRPLFKFSRAFQKWLWLWTLPQRRDIRRLHQQIADARRAHKPTREIAQRIRKTTHDQLRMSR